MTRDIEILSRLAKTTIPGCRHGSSRPMWEHSGDVAHLAGSVPGFMADELDLMVAVGWGHDLLEDGILDGKPVTVETLRAHGVSEDALAGIIALTREEGMSEGAYYTERLKPARSAFRAVKLCDRLANLREGKAVFTATRWEAFVKETHEIILPLADGLPEEAAAWLLKEIHDAI